MNALNLSAARRRNKVVILHRLLSKPTQSVTRPRSISAKQLLKVAAVLVAVAALAVAAGLAAADVLAGKLALLAASVPVCYFCLKGGRS